jgi:hypothetical protein
MKIKKIPEVVFSFRYTGLPYFINKIENPVPIKKVKSETLCSGSYIKGRKRKRKN